MNDKNDVIKNIAIIEGGFSLEKEISLLSSETIFQQLKMAGYPCIKVRIDEDGWQAFYLGHWFQIDRADFSFTHNNQKINFDFAYIVIHGPPGEDGKLQAYFDLLSIPYSTPNQLTSALTFNKFVCNQYLRSLDILVPHAELIIKNQAYELNTIVDKIKLPCFVKPAEGGSSFGISKVKQFSELENAIKIAFQHDDQVIIEQYIAGKELSNGVYKNQSEIESLAVTEIMTENEFFDFDAKYKGESEEITPAKISEEQTQKVKHKTRQIYQLLNLKGICRIDYILDNENLYLLEINTVPGMSPESIIPQMVASDKTLNLSDVLLSVVDCKTIS